MLRFTHPCLLLGLRHLEIGSLRLGSSDPVDNAEALLSFLRTFS